MLKLKRSHKPRTQRTKTIDISTDMASSISHYFPNLRLRIIDDVGVPYHAGAERERIRRIYALTTFDAQTAIAAINTMDDRNMPITLGCLELLRHRGQG